VSARPATTAEARNPADRTAPRPRLIVSQCLGFEPVRYNAQVIRDDFVRRLADVCDVVPVCPEVAIGLGVPRPPIRLVRDRGSGALHVLQPKTGKDVTHDMAQFAASFLDTHTDVDGFVLKNRSPSCGIHDVKVYAPGDDAAPVDRAAGAFGGAVLERFPDAAIEDEGRLRSEALRERFLTLLFALARLREVAAGGERSALVDFHARYKYLLLAYDERGMRELGRIVASVAERPWAETLSLYRSRFARALQRPAKLRAHINALTHAFGHVSDGLSAEERRFFLEHLVELRASRATLATTLTLLRAWTLRFEVPWLVAQAYFRPYPVELQ
jgi:uncharacterized protein YbgA (DUF1722 family)/uncharacterized protein YbbK (DUF523 family)